MDLDRGTLARIDRKLLAGLDQDEVFKMVRVPVTPAKWSTWKRYCNAAGISMGRVIVALIDQELSRIVSDDTDDSPSVVIPRFQEQLASRGVELADRERRLEAVDNRLQIWSRDLSDWQDKLEARERRAEFRSKLVDQPRHDVIKVGRNDVCPCGSGLKYKRCHWLVT